MRKLTNYEKHFRKKMEDRKFRKKYEEEKCRLDVAYQILKLREKNGLTQKKLAEEIDTTQSAVARIEAGKENITIDTLGKIIAVLNKKIAFV
ncbi:transcriptional regulator [bacterium (Candidatus Moisslbacteria) CG12_big_fil_rev_8_21_14_0_65_36_11]|nr:MAG: transcriptional regulator [bacterium (Candidatus Moisslbacteria) CG12_big_fil_rev_8_21_14_0_65_36_11]